MNKQNDELEASVIKPHVDIYIGSSRMGAAAGGSGETKLSSDQIAAIQATISELISGFHPPEVPKNENRIGLESLEVELGFKIEAGSGPLLKLLLDGKGEASIRAKVVWSRPKG